VLLFPKSELGRADPSKGCRRGLSKRASHASQSSLRSIQIRIRRSALCRGSYLMLVDVRGNRNCTLNNLHVMREKRNVLGGGGGETDRF
jgi:hypothetical protein